MRPRVRYRKRRGESRVARRFRVISGYAGRAGVALALSGSSGTLYVGTQFGVYRIPYAVGDRKAQSAPAKIASVRTGGGSGHSTTSVAFANGVLYASVGSSCNACKESDPTRATIQQMHPDAAQ